MSGLEAAGVVLGALPLAIKAVKTYMDILSSMKDAKRNLKFLLQDLETEQIRLETTCEVLLDGIVPPSAVDRLIRTPLGPEWALYNDQIRLRLWTTCHKFEQQVGEMQSAVEELRRRLLVELDGKTKLTDRLSIMRELKRGASFTLKRKDYEEILTRIKMANSILHDLIDQHRGLEPSRKHRSQAHLVRLIRDLTKGIFNGLQGESRRCCCPYSHDVCLELEARDAVILPNDKEDQVARRFDFHVVFGTQREQKKGSESPPKLGWKSIRVKLAENDNSRGDASDMSTISATEPQNTARQVRFRRSYGFKTGRGPTSSLTWSSSSTTTQSLVEVSQTSDIPQLLPINAEVDIFEFCRLVRDRNEPATDGYGHVWDNVERKYELRSPKRHEAEAAHSIITLRQVLARQTGDSMPLFQYPEKLRVAVVLAVSMLHLYKTPWLPRAITLDDVLFLQDKDGKSTYRPFVIRNLEDQPRTLNVQFLDGQSHRPVNLAVLSLGALLIQLMIGKVVDSLDMSRMANQATDMEYIISKYEAGTRLSGEVLTSGGINFTGVVKWCLGAVLEVAGFDNDEFCQKFYGAVVLKLEEDASLLTGDC